MLLDGQMQADQDRPAPVIAHVAAQKYHLLDAAERCEVYALFVERSSALSPEAYEQIENGACKARPLPS